MTPRRTMAVALALAVAIGGLVIAGGAGASAKPTALTATLSGGNEVPDAGSGSGTARLTLNPANGRVCFTIRLRGVGVTPAGHIHRGASGKAGPVVVPLYAKATRQPKGCIRGQDAAALRQIIQRPGRYYVNVHTAEYPDGAARGQLKKK